MAGNWPEHVFLAKTSRPSLYISGRKLIYNKLVEKDGVKTMYFYCFQRKHFECKASATAVWLEGM